MRIKIKMSVTGNKQAHISGLLSRGFSVQTNREGLFNLHRLPVGVYKCGDLSNDQRAEIQTLLNEDAAKRAAKTN